MCVVAGSGFVHAEQVLGGVPGHSVLRGSEVHRPDGAAVSAESPRGIQTLPRQVGRQRTALLRLTRQFRRNGGYEQLLLLLLFY